MRIISLIAATLFATLWSLPAVAASFDCSKATTETEIAICNDDELSALDELVSTSYNLSRKASSDKQKLLSEQRAWIIERESSFDKGVRLAPFMSKRIESLLEIAIGTSYDIVKNEFSKNKNGTAHYSEPKRVILFTPNVQKLRTLQNYHNALFFDKNQKLVKVLVGANYPKESPCTRSFSSNDNDPSKLSIDIECGRQRNHDWNHYGYNLGADCINMTAYTRSEGILGGSNTTYEFQNSKNSCLENYNYNFGSNESPHYFFPDEYDYKEVDLVTKRGLLEFLTHYYNLSKQNFQYLIFFFFVSRSVRHQSNLPFRLWNYIPLANFYIIY